MDIRGLTELFDSIRCCCDRVWSGEFDLRRYFDVVVEGEDDAAHHDEDITTLAMIDEDDHDAGHGHGADDDDDDVDSDDDDEGDKVFAIPPLLIHRSTWLARPELGK